MALSLSSLYFSNQNGICKKTHKRREANLDTLVQITPRAKIWGGWGGEGMFVAINHEREYNAADQTHTHAHAYLNKYPMQVNKQQREP